jgi:hypothetical protein
MPRIDTLVKLATALGIPAAELMDGIRWTPGDAQPGQFSIQPAKDTTAKEQ